MGGNHINMGWSWQRALAALGGHMQQQSAENQRAAREQQRLQAQMQNQMALAQLQAQQEAERNKVLDARWQQEYQLRQQNALAQRAYQENLWKAQQENYRADNARADRELQWKMDQEAAKERQRQAQAQALQGIFGPVPPPINASVGGMASPIDPSAGGVPTDGIPPATPPIGVAAANDSNAEGNSMDPMDAEIAALQRALRAGLFETPRDAFAARTRITELEQAKRERARQRQRDLLDTHVKMAEISRTIKGGGNPKENEISANQKVAWLQRQITDMESALQRLEDNAFNKKTQKTEYTPEQIEQRQQIQDNLLAAKRALKDFGMPVFGLPPTAITAPPPLATDTTTGNGTLQSAPRKALDDAATTQVLTTNPFWDALR